MFHKNIDEMKKVENLDNTSKQQVYNSNVYENLHLDNEFYVLLEKYNSIEIEPKKCK